MKALLYMGPKQLDYQDVPDAVPQEGEELVCVSHVGICGSDMHAYLGHDERRPAPLILGHEAAGFIQGGENDGKRVAINPLVSCLKCSVCLSGRENLCAKRQIISMFPREGAFAELVAIPRNNLVFIPDHVSLTKAALTEPIACGWHASRMVQESLDNSITKPSALILGGGAIGVGAALSIKAQGVQNVTLLETNPVRRDYLARIREINVIGLNELTDNIMFDIVIDGVGFAGTREVATKYVLPGGVIAHIGLGDNEGGLDIRRMTLQEITFIGTYTYTQKDFNQTAIAIFDDRLGELNWVEKRSLSEGAQAFKDIYEGQCSAPKIILQPEILP
ncbi:alcohol dehydrogenase catalytic domain-containing protein [Kiloniella sp. EL199]|uniref:alcohol dehydrogenase catalytic domain-containing protein n=1 Tax=Kiloniella sp. EL199 TaxID=2107581 RepID=UPI000EA23002|nr:alcohol dehydrogenase catalytic domain-containing protein [Kiloniella sp. EL199]